MESYLADRQWRCMKLGQDGELFVFIPFITYSTRIFAWNAKRAEKDCLNSQEDTLIEKKLEKVRQKPR